MLGTVGHIYKTMLPLINMYGTLLKTVVKQVQCVLGIFLEAVSMLED